MRKSQMPEDRQVAGELCASQQAALRAVLREQFLIDNPPRDVVFVLAVESGGSTQLFVQNLLAPAAGGGGAGGSSSSNYNRKSVSDSRRVWSPWDAASLGEGDVVAMFDARVVRRPSEEVAALIESFSVKGVSVGFAQVGDKKPHVVEDSTGRKFRLAFTIVNGERVKAATDERVQVECIEGAVVSCLLLSFWFAMRVWCLCH